jgi:hypothetical protein
VGSPPNLIAIGLIREETGRRSTFFDWAALTMPATVAMLAVSWLFLRWLYREPPGSGQMGIAGPPMPPSPEPWTAAQRGVAAGLRDGGKSMDAARGGWVASAFPSPPRTTA